MSAALSTTLHKSQEHIQEQLEALIQQLPKPAGLLHQALEHALLLGGKRIRPYLIYELGRAVGCSIQTLHPIAIAVECIHTYSLVHDDLPAMDDDSLRRGQPTLHVLFDEATAVLAGDALQTLAFDVLSQPSQNLSAQQQIAMVNVLAKASGYLGMCGGQALDLEATDQAIDLNHLQKIHRLKTGALIKASVQMVCIAGEVPTQHQKTIESFADHLGLAFQIQDDILDVISETKELGKPQGSDMAANKSTYPKLMGLNQAKVEVETLIINALKLLEALPWNTMQLETFCSQTRHRTR
jgi:farnesyl diphosphate synthase